MQSFKEMHHKKVVCEKGEGMVESFVLVRVEVVGGEELGDSTELDYKTGNAHDNLSADWVC